MLKHKGSYSLKKSSFSVGSVLSIMLSDMYNLVIILYIIMYNVSLSVVKTWTFNGGQLTVNYKDYIALSFMVATLTQ